MIDALVGLVDADRAGTPTRERAANYLTGESIASPGPHRWLESTDLVRAIRREFATRRWPVPGAACDACTIARPLNRGLCDSAPAA